MNNTFDIHRFGKLFLKDFRSIWPRFGGILLVVCGLTLVPWVFNLAFSHSTLTSIDAEYRMALIETATLFICVYSCSKIYGSCNLPKEGVYFAMLPASKLEKFISMILISFVVTPLIFFVMAIAADVLLTLLPFGSYHEYLFSYVSNTKELDNFSHEELTLMYNLYNPYFIFISYCFTVVPFLFTCTIFKKHKFLYTVLWMILIGFTLSLIMGIVLTSIFNNVEQGYIYELINRLSEGYKPSVFLNRLFLFLNIFNTLFVAGFGYWSWRRLKNMTY